MANANLTNNRHVHLVRVSSSAWSRSYKELTLISSTLYLQGGGGKWAILCSHSVRILILLHCWSGVGIDALGLTSRAAWPGMLTARTPRPNARDEANKQGARGPGPDASSISLLAFLLPSEVELLLLITGEARKKRNLPIHSLPKHEQHK